MDERRPWLIGESPSRTGDRYWRFPLSGAPARTLCQAAGFKPDGDGKNIADWTWALYEKYRTANVFERYRDATPWSAPVARAAAERRARAIWEGSRVAVLLGRKVGDAFGAGEFFEWEERDGIVLCVVPHPSGRNLLMNSRAVRLEVGAVVRQAPLVAAALRMGGGLDQALELARTALAEAAALAAREEQT